MYFVIFSFKIIFFIVEMKYIQMYSFKIAISKYKVKINRETLFSLYEQRKNSNIYYTGKNKSELKQFYF